MPLRAAVDDVEMAYDLVGDGHPLVLIAGMGSEGDLWPPEFTRELARDFRLLLFDNRGMGDTPPGKEDFTIERFAADTAGLLRAVGIGRAHVLGYSMGGYVAQELALSCPEMVAGLVLVSAEAGSEKGTCIARDTLDRMSDVSGSDAEREERLKELLFPRRWLEEHGEELGAFFAAHAAHPPDPVSMMKQVAAMCAWRGAAGRLPGLDRPVLVIAGGEDEVITPEHSRRLAGLIPGARMAEMEGAGHGILFQFPRELAAVVRDFLLAQDASLPYGQT